MLVAASRRGARLFSPLKPSFPDLQRRLSSNGSLQRRQHLSEIDRTPFQETIGQNQQTLFQTKTVLHQHDLQKTTSKVLRQLQYATYLNIFVGKMHKSQGGSLATCYGGLCGKII